MSNIMVDDAALEQILTNIKNEIDTEIALKTDPVISGSLSINRKEGSPIGTYSATFGKDCVAAGDYSVAEGYATTTTGPFSHSYGEQTFAASTYSSAGGKNSQAYGAYSWVYGKECQATAEGASAQGDRCKAFGEYAHAEGGSSTAAAQYSHAEGVGCFVPTTGLYSHAEGAFTVASGQNAHSEGNRTTVSGADAHAEGYSSIASADGAHAEGNYTTASGLYSHSEGSSNIASGHEAHAEGYHTTASGNWSHSSGEGTAATGSHSYTEGYNTRALYNCAHAEGQATTASQNSSHAEGYYTLASGDSSHAEGYQTKATDSYAHSEGTYTTASGTAAHAEGRNTLASGDSSHAEGYQTTANHFGQHVFGCKNIADPSTAATNEKGNYIEIVGNGYYSGGDYVASNARTLDWGGNERLSGSLSLGNSSTASDNSISVGAGSTAIGRNSMAIGGGANATGQNSVAIGGGANATGQNSVAVGGSASGANSMAIGGGCKTSSSGSVAFGSGSTASGYNSFAHGSGNTASNDNTHAEGYATTASGMYAHSEGQNASASGLVSHAEGMYTIANHTSQHVFGQYNIADPSTESEYSRGDYIEIVGNGISTASRSNARTLDWDGNEELAGNLGLAGTSSDIILSDSGNTWDGTNTSLKSAIAAAGQTGGVTNLSGLSDVNISTVTNGQVLTYDDTSSKWINTSVPTELPPVSTVDNGNILKVVNGAWAKGDDDGISAIQQPASYYLNSYREQSSSPDIFMVYGKIEENVRKNESVSAASNNIYTDPANSELEGYESWRAFHDDDNNGWCTDNSSASLIYKFNVVTVLQSMSFRIKWVGPLLNNHRCDGIRLYYKNNDNEWAGNIRIADYTIRSGSPAGYKDFDITFSSPICSKGGEIKISLNGFELVPEDEDEVKFSIQNVIFKGYKASVQADSKAYGCSIWYKGTCYGNTNLGYKELTGTLATGETTVTITDSSINDTCTYDIYTSVYGVNPTAVTILNNTMTLTFAAQQSDLGVKVRVS